MAVGLRSTPASPHWKLASRDADTAYRNQLRAVSENLYRGSIGVMAHVQKIDDWCGVMRS
jgi:hypothetical protein